MPKANTSFLVLHTQRGQICGVTEVSKCFQRDMKYNHQMQYLALSGLGSN